MIFVNDLRMKKALGRSHDYIVLPREVSDLVIAMMVTSLVIIGTIRHF